MKKTVILILVLVIAITIINSITENDQYDHSGGLSTTGSFTTYDFTTLPPIDFTYKNETTNSPETTEKPETVSCGTFGHTYGDWIIIKEATENEVGKRMHRCTKCGNTENDLIPKIKKLGSAAKIQDKTIIVSIFADDINTRWNPYSYADSEMMDTMLLHLESAVNWINFQCKKYGADPSFVYDWKANPDLFYRHQFTEMSMVRSDGNGYFTQEEYIKENIPEEALKNKYGAQNVIYMLYFNTDSSNTINSWSLSDRQNCFTEVVNVFVRDTFEGNTYAFSASSCAHEILHCFGAYDLYYSSDEIPQAYVDYCANTYSNDIMFTVNTGKNISVLFTDLDAYYVGLIDYCSEVERWGLAKSSHLK